MLVLLVRAVCFTIDCLALLLSFVFDVFLAISFQYRYLREILKGEKKEMTPAVELAMDRVSAFTSGCT